MALTFWQMSPDEQQRLFNQARSGMLPPEQIATLQVPQTKEQAMASGGFKGFMLFATLSKTPPPTFIAPPVAPPNKGLVKFAKTALTNLEPRPVRCSNCSIILASLSPSNL